MVAVPARRGGAVGARRRGHVHDAELEPVADADPAGQFPRPLLLHAVGLREARPGPGRGPAPRLFRRRRDPGRPRGVRPGVLPAPPLPDAVPRRGPDRGGRQGPGADVRPAPVSGRVLAPFGHGLWTAVLGAALLSDRGGDGRFRLTGRVLGTYVGVAVLHALWDSVNGIAVRLVYALTADARQRALFDSGYMPRPTSEQRHLYTLFSDGGLIVVALLGVVWLTDLTRRAGRGNTP
ncbi:PrsW family glutamic-type intramembrane protease [Streptomyces sp. L500]